MPLVIDKEKQAILLNGSAEITSEIVPQQLWRRVGRATLQLCKFDEVIVRTSEGVPVSLKNSTMQLIRTTSRNERYLRARGSSLLRIVIRGCDPKFLD